MSATDYLYDLLFPPVIVDGDTLHAFADLGFKTSIQVIVRLDGLDAPEVHSLDSLELQAGNKAKAIVAAWCAAYAPAGLQLLSNSIDKYGRSLGVISCVKVPQSLNDYLLTNKLVRVYGGEAKKPWDVAVLKAIVDFPMPVFTLPAKK